MRKVPESRKAPAKRGRQQPLTTPIMILQLLDRKMVKRSPFPVYFALIPLVVIQMQGLVESCIHTRQYMGFWRAPLDHFPIEKL